MKGSQGSTGRQDELEVPSAPHQSPHTSGLEETPSPPPQLLGYAKLLDSREAYRILAEAGKTQ